MTTEKLWFQDIPIPALLRHARTTYGMAMHQALEAAGYEDMPKNGMYVIGGLALGAPDIPLGQLIKELRISKQAAGQLVDTLVTRGYLDRRMDSEDRRKLLIGLTDRGKGAAEAQAAARKRIDAELLASVGQEDVDRTRRTLAVLCNLGRENEEESDHES
jgi:DNA-binding MarR family transcriptional regulator